MARCIFLSFAVCFFYNAYGQTLTAAEKVKQYSIAQKKLLVNSTAQFTDFISSGNLDRDSIMSIACKVTGLPFLVAYADDDESSTDEDMLINDARIHDALIILKKLNGEKQIRLLINLARWYLYKAGSYKADLDSANYFIQEAIRLNSATNNLLLYKCLALLAEYNRQMGNETESKKIYFQIISAGQQDGNNKIIANAWYRLGKLHTEIDSVDLTYLNNSLALYHQLQSKEKEMELLWDIGTYYYRNDFTLFKNNLSQILNLQLITGYKHSLFAEYELSVWYIQQGQYLEAMNHANAAIENMKWSGMSALEGSFSMRIGSVYGMLGRDEEALTWYQKGLEKGDHETHIFWYKNLFYAAGQLYYLNRYKECLVLIENTTRKFPPITPWEKAQVETSKGICNRSLQNYRQTDENYRSFLKIINDYPGINRLGEFDGDLKEIVNFYFYRSDVKMARLFANKLSAPNKSLTGDNGSEFIFFKLDSVAGHYKSALDHYINYKTIDDSLLARGQRQQFEELKIKFETEKKDIEIKLLRKDKQLQTSTLLQTTSARNWTTGVAALLLIIVCLLAYNAKIKQKANKKLKLQQTEIEGQNLTLRHLVTEKDWLVKEIHHRVKNNFQTVMSLLGTQSEFLQNEAAINAINDSQRRIESMSLIHQRLYQSNNLSAIPMKDYIYELVNSIADGFNTSDHVRFHFDTDPIELDLKHCTPLGLILNEAITNSFKYAFPDNYPGIISVSLKHTSANNFLLTIKDNGIGLPPGFDIKQSPTMGISLMRGLCAEIGAQFIFSNENGSRIDIIFSYDPDTAGQFTTILPDMPPSQN